jgi:hypothetical protein
LSLAELKDDSIDFKEINLVFDASHFKREFCLFLFRSNSTNIHYDFQSSEKIIHYELALKEIERMYIPLSFTINGRRGVIQLLENMFPSVPIQLCHFHLVQNISRYTTKRPKTGCGKELRELVLRLKSSSEKEFTKKYNEIKERYKEFLKEKNESGEFKHKRLRSAFNAIKSQLPYLLPLRNFPI